MHDIYVEQALYVVMLRVKNRAVESESLKVGKSLKIGRKKKSEKIRKIGFDFLFKFLAKMPKCHKMPKCPALRVRVLHQNIFITLVTLEPEVLHR